MTDAMDSSSSSGTDLIRTPDFFNASGCTPSAANQDVVSNPVENTDDGTAEVEVANSSKTVELNSTVMHGKDSPSSEFSTENYKLEIKNLPKYSGYNELKKLLNQRLSLNARKIKIIGRKGDLAFVNFDSEVERKKAHAVLNGFELRKQKLEAVYAKPAQDPLLRKRKAESETTNPDESNIPAKIQSPENKLDVSTSVKNVVLPWWDVPYEEQINRKTKLVNQFLKGLANQLCKLNKEFVRLKSPETHCIGDIRPVVASPTSSEYRNKSEFTIGYNPETNEETVGFRLASYRDGCIAVGPIDESLHHLPKLMIKAALAFQDYVRQSKFKPFDHVTREGTWKQLTVRTTLDDQLMMIVLVNSNLSEDEAKGLKIDLINRFESCSGLQITSFYFKEHEKSGSKIKNIPELLFGTPTIIETLLGSKFRISPEAFFQINPKATECMYNTIQELAGTDSNTTLLDVCCGTGTIGICLAGKCGQVLGVEIISDAINDAKYNATFNSVADKCEFYTGKAEDIIDALMSKVKFEKIVAVVDPPRAGINIKVIQCLRRHEQIKQIVFAFCDAKGAVKNFIDLSRPTSNSYRGAPFALKTIVPVDLFPSTPHYELVVLFERIN